MLYHLPFGAIRVCGTVCFAFRDLPRVMRGSGTEPVETKQSLCWLPHLSLRSREQILLARGHKRPALIGSGVLTNQLMLIFPIRHTQKASNSHWYKQQCRQCRYPGYVSQWGEGESRLGLKSNRVSCDANKRPQTSWVLMQFCMCVCMHSISITW